MAPSEISLNVHVDRELVSRETDSDRILEVVVRAPQTAKKSHRIPLNLALVIDRSGSMNGGKLEAVKHAAIQVLDYLDAQDRLTLVTFDDQVTVLLPSLLMRDANKSQMKERIYSIDLGGSTALHMGWLTGCKQLARVIDDRTLNRCLLLTDGQANVGTTDTEEIAKQASDLLDRRVSTSTIGVGIGFNEHLLEAMANQGGGNFHFIESEADVQRIFDLEFKDLSEIALRDVEVVVELDPAIKVNVLGSWRVQTPAPSEWRLSLGSISADHERSVFLKIGITPAGKDVAEVPVLVKARGKGENGDVLEAEVKTCWRYASQTEADAEQPDLELMKRFTEVDLADKAAEALKLERAGRRKQAEDLLKSKIASSQPYIDNSQQAYYMGMSDRMARGMDELDRKQSHYGTYMFKQGRAMGEHFHLERPDRHVVIAHNGAKILVDTGSPVSIGRIPGWTFLGKPVNLLPNLQSFNMEYLSQKVGTHLDVLLGMDVMAEYNILLDTQGQHVIFSPVPIPMHDCIEIPMTNYLMKVPAVDVMVEGHPMKLVLDTGARYSFLPRNFLNGRSSIKDEHDFYPGIGDFDTPIFPVKMSLTGEEFESASGILPPALEMTLQATGIQGLLGMDLLDRFQIELAFPENLLHLR